MSTPPKKPSSLSRDQRDPANLFSDERIGDDLAVRIYGRAGTADDGVLVLHFHGGAFIGGDLDSGATVAGLLASANAVVASVDYPLAPAHPFPAAIVAGYAALHWAWESRARLAGSRARLYIAGEEAGGNLAAALALKARDHQLPPLAGQILLSPMLDACLGTASLRRIHAGPATCRWAKGWHQYLADGYGADHPYAVPGQAWRLEGLPPALLITAADDPLRDETLAYRQRLLGAGVPVSLCEPEGPTGWPVTWGETTHPRAPWAAPVRAAFEQFLGEVGADPHLAASRIKAH